MWLLMNDLGLKARLAFSKFMCDEEGDVNIVSIVVLIGIAVLLAVFFKGQIMDLLETLFGTIKDKLIVQYLENNRQLENILGIYLLIYTQNNSNVSENYEKTFR